MDVCVASHDSKNFGLKDQMQRSAISIPSNIAEGAERNGTPEFVHFLGIARGSAAELETLLLLTGELGLRRAEAVHPLQEELTIIRRMLSALMKSLRSRA